MIREALADAVRSSGCAQKRLAALAGLSEKHVSQMMTGRVTGAIPAWEALLRAAGVEVAITAPDRTDATTLAAITALATAALAERRRGCLGRRAIGAEVNEAYCEVIAKRLAQDTLFGAAS